MIQPKRADGEHWPTSKHNALITLSGRFSNRDIFIEAVAGPKEEK